MEDQVRRVESFIPYDEIDPNCLQGAILFDGSKMDAVWQICERLGMQVVADVHTHPGAWHGQSGTDKANPMIPERGHVALIVPNFADRDYMPGEIGIHEYHGLDGWLDRSKEGNRFFKLRWF
jgi:proteasome lid subunit RPN8/RPN11